MDITLSSNWLLDYMQLCDFQVLLPCESLSASSRSPLYLLPAVFFVSHSSHQFAQISKSWKGFNCFKEARGPSQAGVFISFLLLFHPLKKNIYILMFSSIHVLEIFLSTPWIDGFLPPLRISFPSFKPSGYFPSCLLTSPSFFKHSVSRSLFGTQLTPCTHFSCFAVSRNYSGNITY